MAYSARLSKMYNVTLFIAFTSQLMRRALSNLTCPKPFLVTTGRIVCLFVLLVHSQHRPKRLSFSLAGPRGHYFLVGRMQTRRSPPILLARTDVPRCEQPGEFPESPQLGHFPQHWRKSAPTRFLPR